MKNFVFLILSGLLVFAGGCGGGKTTTSTPPVISVAVSPSAQTNLDQGQTLNFTATVSNDSSAKGVSWSMSGTSCTGTACGTFTNSTTTASTYNAPASVSSNITVTIVATSAADTTKSASTGVVVSPPPSVTTASLTSGTVGTAYNATLAASGGAGTLTWSLNTGSSLPAGLSLSGAGAISGTPTAAGTTTFMVKVTDASGGQPGPVSATQQLSLTIMPGPLTITTTSLPNATVSTAYNEPLQAVGGTPPYTWTVTSGSSLPTWLTLGGSGTNWTISGTPSAPGNSAFSLTVTDSTTPTAQTKNQSLSVTVVGVAASCGSGNEAILKGQYAFSLSGYNATGYLAAVGSFTADGSGHITGGTVDSNGALGVQTLKSITTGGSSYSVGSDNRGCATIVTPFYTFTTRFALMNPPASAVASEGTIQEWDSGATPFIGAGQILLQALPGALQNGTYVFQQTGVYGTSELRVGSVGTLTANGSGGFTAGEYDANVNGDHTTFSGLSGTYTTPDSTTGRYTTATSLDGVTNHHVAYLVSNSQYLQLTTDALTAENSVLIAEGQLQSGSLTISGNLVFYATGMESSGTGSYVQIGLVTVTNSTTLSANVYEDDAGTWMTPSPNTSSCTYAIDSYGKLTTSGSSCGNHPPVFYLISSNTAVMLGTDSGVSVGQVLPQLATSITGGTYFFGTQQAVNLGVVTDTGVATLSSGGVANITGDTTSVSSPQQADETESETLTVNSDGTITDSSHPTQVSGITSGRQLVIVDGQGSAFPTILVIKTTPIS